MNTNVTVMATDEYKDRVSMAANSSLLLSEAKLADQRTFTCMAVASSDVTEYPVNVVVYSEYTLLQVYNSFSVKMPRMCSRQHTNHPSQQPIY